MARTGQVYTVRFGYLDRDGPFDVVLYTATSSLRAIVRDIVAKTSPDSVLVTFYVRTPGGEIYHLGQTKSALEQVAHLEMRQALGVGDQLHVTMQNGHVYCAVTGWELIT